MAAMLFDSKMQSSAVASISQGTSTRSRDFAGETHVSCAPSEAGALGRDFSNQAPEAALAAVLGP
jgi:hypothetical protein